MIFDTWLGVARILIIGTAAYLSLVLMLRISGKRTLSKLNAFDLVVTVALGSVLATVILSRSVPLVEGITALALLIALQFIITWMSVRVGWFGDLVKSEPTVVFSKGAYVRSAMRKQRLTEGEILAAIRSSGHRREETVDAVILETDGSLSVLTQ
ncbi:DUF421 domain-containing protein [Rhizobium halophytocola]|uniref:Uncharacterized membrane protein YcaP (DUF421 family) n=1 Tax=Rhizobium halophytocola TaxID=735519 RepID=A0ABS4E688_9HYPH|nr:YetF domain-containing protein [Rhizobium halophytocola]MBP1853462.1 uncharacterized membrane protein YcaP (DUF421 family) [Rhizobium halophytocola]